MGRVLRIGAGLMGVVLVVMTAGLWSVRRQPAREPIMLVDMGRTAPQRGTYLALFIPGMDEPRPLLKNQWFLDLDSVGPSPDGQWLYFIDDTGGLRPGSSQASGTLYRVNLHTFTVQEVARDAVEDAIVWTPDGEWLVYIRLAYPYPVIKMRPDGSEKMILTRDLPSDVYPLSWDAPIDALLITPDGKSVFFSGSDGEIYRAWLSNGHLENTTAGLKLITHHEHHPPEIAYPCCKQVLYWPTGAPAFMMNVWGNDGYWMYPDGSPLQPVLADSSLIQDVVDWLPEANLLIIIRGIGNRGQYLSAIHPYDPEPVWDRVWSTYYEWTIFGDWIVYQDTAGIWWRIHRVTGERVFIRHGELWPYPSSGAATPSPVLNWMSVLTKPDPTKQPVEFATFLLNIMTGEMKYLATLDKQSWLNGWSPDGKWLVYIDHNPAAPGLYRMDWLTGETERILPSRPDLICCSEIAWGPPMDRQWSPAILLVAAIGMCAISLIRLRPAA